MVELSNDSRRTQQEADIGTVDEAYVQCLVLCWSRPLYGLGLAMNAE